MLNLSFGFPRRSLADVRRRNRSTEAELLLRGLQILVEELDDALGVLLVEETAVFVGGAVKESFSFVDHFVLANVLGNGFGEFLGGADRNHVVSGAVLD